MNKMIPVFAMLLMFGCGGEREKTERIESNVGFTSVFVIKALNDDTFPRMTNNKTSLRSIWFDLYLNGDTNINIIMPPLDNFWIVGTDNKKYLPLPDNENLVVRVPFEASYFVGNCNSDSNRRSCSIVFEMPDGVDPREAYFKDEKRFLVDSDVDLNIL